MSKNLKIFVVMLVVVVLSGIAIFIISRLNYNEDISVSVVESSTADSGSDMPRGLDSASTEELNITLSDNVGGFDQSAILRAVMDYCELNDITGDVLVSDSGFNEDDSFYSTIEFDGQSVTFTYNLFDYKL